MYHRIQSTPARLGTIAFVIFFSISSLSRIILTVTSLPHLTWDFSLLGAFIAGLGFDAVSALFAAILWILLGVIAPDQLIKSKVGKILVSALMTLFLGILIFITTAEWFFWDEFSARFNFIAVDYLIWTQEVWGNISESYPMVPIFTGIVAVAAGLVWVMRRRGLLDWAVAGSTSWQSRCVWPTAGLAAPALAVVLVSQSSIPEFTNAYHGELAKNGCWSFFAAFKQMELNYEKWYLKLPKEQALSEAKTLLMNEHETATSPNVEDLHRSIQGDGAEKRWNIIFVCMESMSGEFMSYVKNEKSNDDLTPNLNRLAQESLFFENLYATGTRTVRGMEALTLGLPPTPGQAIIYRPEGTDLATSFSPFTDRGYDCAFFYGGDGRFDFMNRYFSTSGCRIMDVNGWKPEDTTFKTSWGACDEDLFNKTMKEADASYAAGKPFHYFCMTTSNHRPYDYPEGRIDIPSHSGRRGAVKYADWAIGDLITKASEKPWFKDTLFVIVADHCASCAGKTELDVTKYRIPGMIYNPTLVTAKTVPAMCSQIDVMPTVFGMLGWKYETLSYGHDLLSPAAPQLTERAFVSNYQKIALLRNEGIAILKPNRQFSTYACDRTTGDFSSLDSKASDQLLHDTTVFYQSASWLFSSGGMKHIKSDTKNREN
jgi:phosphoglycerol transferase MdoB-like AlkP superfamily enzyme